MGKPTWHRDYLKNVPWASSYDVTTRLLNERQLGLGAELGIAGGFHIDQILLRCPTVSVIGVDLFGGWGPSLADRIAMLDLLAPHGDRFTFLNMSTVCAVTHVPDGLDWAYVDASHDRPAVARDLDLWYPKVRKGGLFMGHDYGGEYTEQVKPAVDRFLRGKGLKLTGVEDTVWWIDL